MALRYRQVKDLYDTIRESGGTTATLPEWSQEMNRLTESNLFDEGQHDNFIKRASVGLDRLIEATGIPRVTESFGRRVGSLVGDEETGATIGKGLGRGAINMS